MKKLIFLFISLIANALFAQVDVLEKSFSPTSSVIKAAFNPLTKQFIYESSLTVDSMYSQQFNLDKLNFVFNQDFNGLISSVIRIDSTGTPPYKLANPDCVIVFPVYWVGGKMGQNNDGWFIGDTLTWTVLADVGTPATTKFLKTSANIDIDYMWRSNGESTLFQGYSYENFRFLYKFFGANIKLAIKQTITRY